MHSARLALPFEPPVATNNRIICGAEGAGAAARELPVPVTDDQSPSVSDMGPRRGGGRTSGMRMEHEAPPIESDKHLYIHESGQHIHDIQAHTSYTYCAFTYKNLPPRAVTG